MQQAATAVMKGGNLQVPKVSAKTIAEQLAEKINQKLNYVPQVGNGIQKFGDVHCGSLRFIFRSCSVDFYPYSHSRKTGNNL